MWVAFTVAAVLTAYFVVKLSTALERREEAMAEMRERAARHERLAAVTTLAAGAAHELGTPLATIAVASRELERAIRALPESQGRSLIEDASLIRSELERCRAILSRLAADSGQRPGEAPEEVDVPKVVADIVRGVPPAHRDRLRVEVPKPGRGPSVPQGALVQVAQSLLQNAFEAGGGPVTLSVQATAVEARRARRGPGQRHVPGDPGPRRRALLLHQAPGAGDGARPLHRPHAQRADGRPALPRVAPRPGDHGDRRDRRAGARSEARPCRLTRRARPAC